MGIRGGSSYMFRGSVHALLSEQSGALTVCREFTFVSLTVFGNYVACAAQTGIRETS
jgi:hypothetical protein